MINNKLPKKLKTAQKWAVFCIFGYKYIRYLLT